jgi:hypothetical protein
MYNMCVVDLLQAMRKRVFMQVSQRQNDKQQKVRLRIRKGRFTSHFNGMTSDGQNSVAAIVLNTFLSKIIKNNYIFSPKNANYATLEDKLNVFLSEPVNTGLPNICLLFFFHIQFIPNKFQYNNILFPKSFYIVL